MEDRLSRFEGGSIGIPGTPDRHERREVYSDSICLSLICPASLQGAFAHLGNREPGIHTHESWLWVPGSLATLGPRNDVVGTHRIPVTVLECTPGSSRLSQSDRSRSLQTFNPQWLAIKSKSRSLDSIVRSWRRQSCANRASIVAIWIPERRQRFLNCAAAT
jgi:hypothetical protein